MWRKVDHFDPSLTRWRSRKGLKEPIHGFGGARGRSHAALSLRLLKRSTLKVAAAKVKAQRMRLRTRNIGRRC